MVAAQVLSERTGRLAAQLMGYRGVRILQDNVLWKPPGTKAIGFHQDSSYADYLVPPEMVTCWISLHDTEADAGPLELVRGSHVWPKSPPQRDAISCARRLARGRPGRVPGRRRARDGARRREGRRRLVPSRPHLARLRTEPQRSVARMALVSHLIPVETRFHETNVDVTYSRYRRRGDLSLDESFFPVLWTESGYRTPWLAELPAFD